MNGMNGMAMRRAVMVAVTAVVLASGTASNASGQSTVQTNVKVNVNTATETQLAYLPGIGPKLASAIHDGAETGEGKCDHRCQYKELKDLLRVKGVGDKVLAKIAPYVTFTGPTTATEEIKVAKAAKAKAVKP